MAFIKNINCIIKNDIIKYYKDKKAITWHYSYIDKLNKRLIDIDNEMKNPLIFNSLNTDIKAVNYDTNIKSNSLSYIETQIDNLYISYENEKSRIINDISLTKNIISDLEYSVNRFDFYFNMLDDDFKNILELKFDKSLSITAISFKVNMSKSSVSRKLDYILSFIAQLYSEYTFEH